MTTTAPIRRLASDSHDHDARHSMSKGPLLATSPCPIKIDRMLSSPPISPDSHFPILSEHRLEKSHATIGQDILTPPTTPLHQFQLATSIDSPTKSAVPRTLPWPSNRTLSLDALIQHPGPKASNPVDDVPVFDYPFEFEVVKDDMGRLVKFGEGAWSNVYKAVSQPPRRLCPGNDKGITPVVSRLSPLVVAVKTPARKDGRDILRNEAKILSHLIRRPGVEDHVVSFQGFQSSTWSIVMSAVPLSLSQHLTDKLLESKQSASALRTHPPIIGSEAIWISLASRLIDGLQWLHEVGEIVHGDIKPHNILLQPIEDAQGGEGMLFPYTPLFVDFSSACHLSAKSRLSSPGALSAVTREYTAPELLISSVLRDPSTLPTTASDVFSMAVTLLVGATGDLNVYPAANIFQRQAMASQGWDVINFARSGSQGLRVPRYGIVEQILERAVLKAGMGRVDARTWAAIAREKARGEPTKRA